MKKHLNPKQTVFDTFNNRSSSYVLSWDVSFTAAHNPHIVVDGVGMTLDEYVYPTVAAHSEVLISARDNIIFEITYKDGTTEEATFIASEAYTDDDVARINVTAGDTVLIPIFVSLEINNYYSGVFTAIKSAHSADLDVDVTGLDEEYLIGHSKHKAPSTELETYALMFGTNIELEDGERLRAISSRGISRLAEHIWSIYGLSWTRIYDALIAEYEPIENYNMEEIETPNLTTTHAVSDDYSMTDEHAVSDDYKLTDTEKRASKIKTENDNLTNESLVKAFNSSDYVGSGKNVATGSTTTTGLENDNKTTNERTQTGSTSDKHTQTGSTSESQTGTRTLTRHGNVGVTTNQQMLTSEVELRVKTQMWSIMMADADKVLSAPSYHEGLTEIWL